MIKHRVFPSIAEWRPIHLLGAWIAYWILALVVGLASALPLLWRLTRTAGHGTAAAVAGNGAVGFTITTAGQTWARSLSYGSLTLIALVPPLLIWLAWVIARPRRVA